MFRGAVTSLRVPNLLAQLLLIRDQTSFVRVQFLTAAIETGLLKALPATHDELVHAIGVQRPDVLDGLLALGVGLKELSLSGGRYRARGQRAKVLASDSGDALAAMLEELAGYHSDVYRRMLDSLRGAPSRDYLTEHSALIARSSRALEPYMAPFVRSLAKRYARLLEVGCGSGVYLRVAAEANAQLTGTAIEMAPAVVEQARANLVSWGVAGRFQVLAGDARHLPAEVTGPFGLITLYNNVYYFTPEERSGLLRSLRSLLVPGGTFALVTLVPGKSVISLDFDLALRCTAGCTPLPSVDDVTALLREAGFSKVQTTRLMPTEPFYGFAAT
jgi:SAM-dependent methyltransferase